jgi:hypothetical protein
LKSSSLLIHSMLNVGTVLSPNPPAIQNYRIHTSISTTVLRI